MRALILICLAACGTAAAPQAGIVDGPAGQVALRAEIGLDDDSPVVWGTSYNVQSVTLDGQAWLVTPQNPLPEGTVFSAMPRTNVPTTVSILLRGDDIGVYAYQIRDTGSGCSGPPTLALVPLYLMAISPSWP